MLRKRPGTGGPEPGREPAGDAGKIELPEFGLAEDILAALEAQVAAREAAAAAPPVDPADIAAAPADEAAPAFPVEESSPWPSPAASPLAGPERVYAFVDRLQNRSGAEPEVPREEPEIWVSFELAGETYALPVTRVEEVLRIGAITRVPHAPAPIRGITNLRGRVLAVVDLRVRLGLPPAEPGPQSRILVVSSRDRSIGLLVDAARQVVRILPSAVQAAPSDVLTEQSDFLTGVYHHAEELVILLDVDQVLWIPDSLMPPRPSLEGSPENGPTPGSLS
ncbi:MAG TPA: chemotaxis protein CheW [Thermoanaerobaculia bacterium]|nr:chemotaxis protein CheW [Thermoanaerobaculia bacterium]